jgi:2-oxoacid:acceptor oxidoreductase gamma subunit (pyruvate/2-ketoisovalerate family)/2-oxoacid:acceptor oxidoreductase delta subunit (pyruvate/2-ketoisovalerate family)
MKEMLLVGRGGEGVVLASQILADTLARAGFWVQSFPEFKAERRGAPIAAFLRWDERSPIHRRYKMQDCDVLVVMSATPPAPELLARVRPNGLVVLNRDTRFAMTGELSVARVPASRLAQRHGILSAEGRPLGNIAVLGACVRLLLPDGLPLLEEAIEWRMGALAAPNVLAARAGYERCVKQSTRAGDTRLETTRPAPAPRVAPLFPASSTDSLVVRTGGWSIERPTIQDVCTACGVCALFCPEGAISRSDGSVVVDYHHCKGCGICAVVCPVRNAIAMEEVLA